MLAWILSGQNCVAALYTALPPVFGLVVGALVTMVVFLLVQRFYQFYKNPYSDIVRREPWQEPVSLWRCILVHHVYLSVLFPCGWRCCVVHAAECMVHVSVLMMCTAFGYWKMAPVTEFMSASEERSMQFAIVLASLLFRLLYARPGWVFRWRHVPPEVAFPDAPLPSEWEPSEASIRTPNNSLATLRVDVAKDEFSDHTTDDVEVISLTELEDHAHENNDAASEDHSVSDHMKQVSFHRPAPMPTTPVVDFELVVADDDSYLRPRVEPDLELFDPSSWSETLDSAMLPNRVPDASTDAALQRFGLVDAQAERQRLVQSKTTDELRFGANLDDVEEDLGNYKHSWAVRSSIAFPDDAGHTVAAALQRQGTFVFGSVAPGQDAAAPLQSASSFALTPNDENLTAPTSGAHDLGGFAPRRPGGDNVSELYLQFPNGNRTTGTSAAFRSTDASQVTISNVDLPSDRSLGADLARRRETPPHDDPQAVSSANDATSGGAASTKTVVLRVDPLPQVWTNDLAFDDEELAFELDPVQKPAADAAPTAGGVLGSKNNSWVAEASQRGTLKKRGRHTPPPISDADQESGMYDHPPATATGRAKLCDTSAVAKKKPNKRRQQNESTDPLAGATELEADNARVIALSGFTEDIAFGDDAMSDEPDDADITGRRKGDDDADGVPRLRAKNVFLGKPPPLFSAAAAPREEHPHAVSDDPAENLFAKVLTSGEANPLLEPEHPTLVRNAQLLVMSKFTDDLRFDDDDISGNRPATSSGARLQQEHHVAAARVGLWDAVGVGAEHVEKHPRGGEGSRPVTTTLGAATGGHNSTFRIIPSAAGFGDAFFLDIDVDDEEPAAPKTTFVPESEATSKLPKKREVEMSALWTADMAFDDVELDGPINGASHEGGLKVDTTAADPHGHRRADLYTHDAVATNVEVFESDEMLGLALPLGSTAATVYQSEMRREAAKRHADLALAAAPFAEDLVFSDWMEDECPPPSSHQNMPHAPPDAAAPEWTKVISENGSFMFNESIATISLWGDAGDCRSAFATCVVVGDDGEMMTVAATTFEEHQQAPQLCEGAEGDFDVADADAASSMNSIGVVVGGIELLEFHPVTTYHIPYLMYLVGLFILTFMLASFFGVQQRLDEYNQCPSYSSDFLQMLLIWDLLFGQSAYAVLYLGCRVLWAWPMRVHWSLHPTNGGMAACFRKDCQQCWKQRAIRGQLDHYDDFETLDTCWMEAFDEPAEQAPVVPFDDEVHQHGSEHANAVAVDGLAFVVMDIDSDDDLLCYNKNGSGLYEASR